MKLPVPDQRELACSIEPGPKVIRGDHDGGTPQRRMSGRESTEKLKPPAALAGIHCREGVIDHQHLGVEGKGAGESDPLVEISGDLGGTEVGQTFQTGNFKSGLDLIGGAIEAPVATRPFIKCCLIATRRLRLACQR